MHSATSVRLTGRRCRMTRLCCRPDKDKLHLLENVSSLPPPLYTSFFFFLPLGVVQMCATPKGDGKEGEEADGGCISENIPGGKMLPFTVYRSGTVFYHGTCPHLPIHAHAQQTPSPQTNPERNPLKRIPG